MINLLKFHNDVFLRNLQIFENSSRSHRRCALKKVCSVIEKRLQRRYFSVNILKFFRTPKFGEHSQTTAS